MSRLKAILYAERARRYAELLPALPPDITVVACETEAEAIARAPGARALATWAHQVPAALLAQRDLEWVHALSAGVEDLLTPELAAGPLLITNSRGANAPPIAEHVIALMLALARQVHRYVRQQAERRWERHFRLAFELAGRTVGILGLGSIGREVAARSGALGMRVIGLRRQGPGEPVPGAEGIYPPAELHRFLAESDFAVVTLPLTAETRGLVDAAALAALPPGSYLINVARGAIVDEGALIRALESGHLAGAGLDVFEQEPLPPESPLWAMNNVIVTPHVSAASPRTMERVMALWARNLQAFAAGRPLLNVVDKQLGY